MSMSGFICRSLVGKVLCMNGKLGSAFGGPDDQIREQNAKMAQLREEEPSIDKYIGMLESRASFRRRRTKGINLGGDRISPKG